MKVSVIINVYNEGLDLERTIADFQEKAGDCELEFIVVADGTTDGSVKDLPPEVKVLVPEERVGIGKAKDIGCKHASGDVLMHTDGHARIARGTIAELAQLALDLKPCIITPTLGPLSCAKMNDCPKARSKACTVECPANTDHIWVPPNCYHGGDLLMGGSDCDRGLYVKCSSRPPPGDKPFFRVNAVNPSCFLYSQGTLLRLGGWNRYPGWWGSQELGLSLRAWFTATPIYVAREQVVLHRYRSWNHPEGKALAPYPIPEGHRGANWRYAHRVVFSNRTWDRVWVPWFQRFAPGVKAEELLKQSEVEEQHESFAERKTESDAEFFQDILKKPFPLDWHLANPKTSRALYAVGAGLGNVLMTIPAQKALFALHGRPLDILAKDLHQEGVAELLGMQPWVRKVLRAEPDLSYYGLMAGSYWAEGPFFVPSETRAGEAPRAWRTMHEVEANLSAIRGLGFRGPTPSPALMSWKAQNDLPPDQYVAVGVGCGGFKSKLYPHWEACCTELKLLGFPLLFLGTANDDQPWMDGLGLNLCGKTPITAAAGVLWASRFYLGIDNGLSHLAAAMNCPSLLLYGPSSERKNRPWSPACQVVRAGLECEPCWDRPHAKKCSYDKEGQRPCLSAIDPGWVAHLVGNALNGTAWAYGDTWPLYLSRKQEVVNVGAHVLQKHAEMEGLIRLLRTEAIRNVLEIGCADGSWLGFIALCSAQPLHILTVDPDPNAYHDPLHCPQDWPRHFPDVVKLLQDKGHQVDSLFLLSDQAEAPVREWVNSHGPLDLLHIDGDHSVGQCWKDWERYRGLVRPGGLVVFHDTHNPTCPGPGMVVHELILKQGFQSWSFTAPGKAYGITVLRIPPGTGVAK